MSKKAVAIRHVHFEDLGLFGRAIEAAGYAIRYCDAGIDDLKALRTGRIDLLVLLGAPIGAYEADLYPFLTDEIALARERLAARSPLLGICLGAQLMAWALGARVYPGPAKEIGWAPLTLTDDALTGPLRHFEGFPVLHWHGDTFDLPNEALRLASTAACVNQAFALGNYALAVQFHPEADGANFERWLIGHAVEIAAAGLSVTELREQCARHAVRAGAQGRRCLDEWLAGIERGARTE